jgi:hypothetical protein
MNTMPTKTVFDVKCDSGTENSLLRQFIFLLSLFAIMLLVPLSPAHAQEGTDKNSILLTIFLRHDQSKTLEEIQAHLEKTGFDKNFPPAGTEVVSWYVMMGIGQVVTLRVPAEKLREVNVAIEKGAWGAFRSEFYPTYDYRPIWEAQRKAP